MKKRHLLSIAVVLVVVFFATVSLSVEYCGSKNSNKYHYPDCKWAKKIKASNLIVFESAQDAVAAGYIPCKVCKPPLPSKSEQNIIQNVDIAKVNLTDTSERRGCCSWHGGVCGCDEITGKYICCDGTLSPSCY